MRDQHDRAPLEQLAHPLEETALGARVERGRRLVEDHERCVAEEGAGEGDPLPLSDREVEAARELSPQHRLVALGQGREELIRVRALRGLDDRVHVVDSLPPPQTDVLSGGQQVLLEVLEDHGDRAA